MITQKFKGDLNELRIEAAGTPAMQVVSTSLDQFLSEGGDSNPFLLMLYDEGRMPFSDRVPRDSFVAFIREALARFPNTGTFETYIFILEAIFGEGSGVLFDVPAPGKIEMLVNASSSVVFDLVFREFIDGELQTGQFLTHDDDFIQTRGISGIDSEFELAMLLAELIPGGIYPDITLAFFALYNFVSSGGDQIVDHLGNQIVFIET